MVCDRDCFNCTYSDCIQERMSSEERADIKARDIKTFGKKERKSGNPEYYQKHKEERKAYQREYYKRNKEKIDEYRKEWLDKNRDHWNAYKREWNSKKKVGES